MAISGRRRTMLAAHALIGQDLQLAAAALLNASHVLNRAAVPRLSASSRVKSP
jgi:hypothetical protein